MSKAFVYTELQLSVPFDQYGWRDANPGLRAQPGFRNKTWLALAPTRSADSTSLTASRTPSGS